MPLTGSNLNDSRAARLTLESVESGVCAIGTWRNVVVIVWWSAGTGPATQRLEQVTAQMRTVNEKSTHIHLVKNRAGMPDADARTTLVKIMREHAEGIANCAVVVGGTGFWASTMRSAITSMRLLSPRSFEMRLHSTAAEMIAWLPKAHVTRTGVTMPEATLSALLQQAGEWLENGMVLHSDER